MEEMRVAKTKEYDELMRLLERSYGGREEGWFSAHYPQLYGEKRWNPNNSLIIRREGKIVGHVGVFPLNVFVGEEIIKVGGIGGVATDPDFRGQHLMQKLMHYSITKMEGDGFGMSVLGGDRQRYGNFGWEFGGRDIVFNFTERSLLWREISPINISRYEDNENDLERVISLHEAETFKVERSKADYSALLAKEEVWLANDAYAIGRKIDNKVTIIECGGAADKLLGLIFSLIKNLEIEEITMQRPYEDNALNQTLLEASARWSFENHTSIRIINLAGLLKGFEKQMSARDYGKDKSITIEISATNETATLDLSAQGVSVSSKIAPEKLILSHMEMVRFLFGALPACADVAAPLRGIFPLDFYVWPLDMI